jgi:hypothetical protein
MFDIGGWVIAFISMFIVISIILPFSLSIGPIIGLIAALYCLLSPIFLHAKKLPSMKKYTVIDTFKDKLQYRKRFLIICFTLFNIYLIYKGTTNKIIIIICSVLIGFILLILIGKIKKFGNIMGTPSDIMTPLSSFKRTKKICTNEPDIIPPSMFSIFNRIGNAFTRYTEAVVQDPAVQEYNMSSTKKRYNRGTKSKKNVSRRNRRNTKK